MVDFSTWLNQSLAERQLPCILDAVEFSTEMIEKAEKELEETRISFRVECPAS